MNLSLSQPIQLVFKGETVKCEKCGSEFFVEHIDDHCQIFKCCQCGQLVVFGNGALVRRVRQVKCSCS